MQLSTYPPGIHTLITRGVLKAEHKVHVQLFPFVIKGLCPQGKPFISADLNPIKVMG